MNLLTPEQRQQLSTNGHPDNRGKDHYPVVKLFLPGTNARWLLTELDPDEPDVAFGLCDLGLGFPELGYVLVSELETVSLALGWDVECDSSFESKYPISVYARAARLAQAITEEPHLLSTAQQYATAQRPNRPGPQP